MSASSYSNVTVAATATQILFANNDRRSFVISNNGTQTIYLGLDNTVTTTTGVQILPQSTFSQNGPYMWKGNVWGITASSTSDVRYWDTGV